MVWVNKLREKIKEGGEGVKEWSNKQWIKFKNWWKKNWKTVATVVSAIAVTVIIVVGIYYLTSALVKTNPSFLTNSSEVVKNLPVVIKENFNPPAIISNSSDLSIKIPDLSHILRALEIRDTASELTNLISNISTPYENTTSTITSENNNGLITSIFNEKDIPHHLRQAYNCDLTINNERFTRLEISQYYKTKPGREMINDDLIRKIVASLNGKKWDPDTKKRPDNWNYFARNICYENRNYRLVCGRDENNSSIWGVVDIYPIKVKNKN